MDQNDNISKPLNSDLENTDLNNTDIVDSAVDGMKDRTIEPEEVAYLLDALDSAIDAMKKDK